MPAKVKVRILAGRNLPVMDKSSDASDAFVEVKLGNTTYKTEVYRRSLNPFWNSEWFRFEVSDQELQDEPLQIRIMDYDTYSANDAIGKVYINLNPLLLNPGRSMSGWLPIYDTLHGIRGEINCMVKVNLFSDNNRYRHSSCGVRFFFSDIPNGYKCDAILGFVDELLVNDDPEYQWIDKIRTPRASNEARQTLFTKLSGEVQRKLGLKAEIFGGNAVIGYQQSFDLEGGSGIVGRGIGTAVVLSKIGFPYMGIISPLHGNNPANAPYPTYSKNSLLSNQLYKNNSNSYNQKQFSYHDRHLVHSVSADYFYEVPTRAYKKKISSVINSSNKSNDDCRIKMTRNSSSNDIDCVDLDEDDDDDNNSNYEDCEQSLNQSSSTTTTSDDESSSIENSDSNNNNEKTSVELPKYNPLHAIKRISNLNKSSNLSSSTEHNSTRDLSSFYSKRRQSANSRRKLSANYFIAKLRQTNDTLTQTLANVTKPINTSSNKGLTKLLPFRKPKQQSRQQQRATNTEPTNSIVTKQETGNNNNNNPGTNVINAVAQQKSKSLSKSISDSSSPSATTNIPTTNSTISQSTASATGNSSSESQKRRRDKSLSASIDDALSIIEEKHDDDDYVNTLKKTSSHNDDYEQPKIVTENNQEMTMGDAMQEESRSRLSSGTSAIKHRQMVRSKEIDLNDDSESGSLIRSKAFCVSSADDDEIDDIDSSATTLSSSTVDAKTSVAQSESVLSSSTPSSSMLTEETVKAAQFSINNNNSNKDSNNRHAPIKTKLSSQLSSPVNDQESDYNTMRRSETDLTALSCAQLSNNNNIKYGNKLIQNRDKEQNGAHRSISRSESTYTNTQPTRVRPDSRNSLQQQQSSKVKGNFVQTVKTIKAEQKLLQNLVKLQNQNLGSNRTKNMLIYPNRVHQSEYPFVTLKRFPEKMIECTGGVVSVHSVKLLDHIINDEESETRDIWWTEIRKEIRSHAKALNCNTILGYSETSKVVGDVCILSACGTAAILRDPLENNNNINACRSRSRNNSVDKQEYSQTLKVPRTTSSPPLINSSMPTTATTNTCANSSSFDNYPTSTSALDNNHIDMIQQQHGDNIKNTEGEIDIRLGQETSGNIDCSFAHTSLKCLDTITSLADCVICKSSKVPSVLLLTIEPPQNLNIATMGTMIQARVCRAKRDSHGEASAKEIGDALPFLEYELHRQLFSKLKFKGLNCLFNLNIDISVGENMLTGIATGTGCFVIGLPTPEPPQISAGKGIKASKLAEIQRLIAMCASKNREKLGLDQIQAQLELYHKNKGTFVAASPASAPETPVEQMDTTNNLNNLSDIPTNNNLLPSTSYSNHDSNSSTDFNASGDNTNHNNNSRKISNHSMVARSQQYNQNKKNRHHYNHHRNKRLIINREDRNLLSSPAENLINLLTDDNNIVLEVDDNEDADIIALLIDSDVPEGYLVCNSEAIPSINQSSITSINMFTQVMRSKLIGVDQFAQQFDWIMQSLFVKLRRSLPCCLTNINFVVDLPESHIVQISVTGCLLSLSSPPVKVENLANEIGDTGLGHNSTTTTTNNNNNNQTEKKLSANNNDDDNNNKKEHTTKQGNRLSSVGATISSATSSTSITSSPSLSSSSSSSTTSPTSSSATTLNSSIDITSLSYIPGAKEYHYLGNLSFSFVRETNSVRENGGLNGFIHCFLMEVYAIVRAHVSALGGNAFLSFRLQQSCIFYHSNKNQAQCLISVAGDATDIKH